MLNQRPPEGAWYRFCFSGLTYEVRDQWQGHRYGRH